MFYMHTVFNTTLTIFTWLFDLGTPNARSTLKLVKFTVDDSGKVGNSYWTLYKYEIYLIKMIFISLLCIYVLVVQ